jgi:hypothetical protein
LAWGDSFARLTGDVTNVARLQVKEGLVRFVRSKPYQRCCLAFNVDRVWHPHRLFVGVQFPQPRGERRVCRAADMEIKDLGPICLIRMTKEMALTSKLWLAFSTLAIERLW